MWISWTNLGDAKDFPYHWTKARKIWKLKQRLKRLCARAKGKRGGEWYEINDQIFFVLNSLVRLGVSVEEINRG